MQSETFLVVGLLACFAAFLIIRRRSAPRRPGLFDTEAEELARSQLQQLVADLQDVSREQVARLDARVRELQQLLAEADRRIRELKSVPAPARPANPLHDEVYALADAGRTIAQICQETGLEEGEVGLVLGLRKVASSP